MTDLPRIQQHTQQATAADPCKWCPDPDCSGDQRWTHDRWDAESETRIRRLAITPSPLLRRVQP